MTATLERRYVSPAGRRVSLESRAADKAPRISGMAALYYDAANPGSEFILWDDGPDRCVERILPGAFDRALKDADDVRALFNHDPSSLLGRVRAGTLALSASAEGLAYEIDPPDTQTARDLAAMIRRGDVTGSSFAFSAESQSYSYQKRDGGGILYVREVRSVRLFDVGPVTFPAYEGTTAGVRAAGDVAEARAAFESWRRSQNRTIAGRLAAVRARAVEVGCDD